VSDNKLTPAEAADLNRLLWFAGLVRDMRRLQRDYFRSRRGQDLRDCKELERIVDESITLFLDPRQAVLPLSGPEIVPVPRPGAYSDAATTNHQIEIEDQS
jgi:hypothetical protein